MQATKRHTSEVWTLKQRVEVAIGLLATGTNPHRYPLCGFGAPDADLDPRGDAGIVRVTRVDDGGVTVLCGANKTFRHPTFEESFRDERLARLAERATEAVATAPGEAQYTGDDWEVLHATEVTVPWVVGASGRIMVHKTAEELVAAVRAALRPYREAWEGVHLELRNLDPGKANATKRKNFLTFGQIRANIETRLREGHPATHRGLRGGAERRSPQAGLQPTVVRS